MSQRAATRLRLFHSSRQEILKIVYNLLFVVLPLPFIVLACNLEGSDTKVQADLHQLSKDYGLTIHHVYIPTLFFSDRDRLPPVAAKGSQISLRHLKSILPIVKEFLSKYPTAIIRRHLSDIYLLGTLEFYGSKYGGTYRHTAIYVSTKGRWLRHSNRTLLGLMHAEFSSILFHHYEFPKKEWKAINDPSWIYPDSDRGSGLKMLGQNDLDQQTEELLHRGFLERFAQSDLENDFNTFVVWLFTKPDRLKDLSSRYDRIKKKCKLTMQFYKSVNSEIDIPTVC